MTEEQIDYHRAAEVCRSYEDQLEHRAEIVGLL